MENASSTNMTFGLNWREINFKYIKI